MSKNISYQVINLNQISAYSSYKDTTSPTCTNVCIVRPIPRLPIVRDEPNAFYEDLVPISKVFTSVIRVLHLKVQALALLLSPLS